MSELNARLTGMLNDLASRGAASARAATQLRKALAGSPSLVERFQRAIQTGQLKRIELLSNDAAEFAHMTLDGTLRIRESATVGVSDVQKMDVLRSALGHEIATACTPTSTKTMRRSPTPPQISRKMAAQSAITQS